MRADRCDNDLREFKDAMFFFFQAEDGIRDYDVTGVQTCALPICRELSRNSMKKPGIWLNRSAWSLTTNCARGCGRQRGLPARCR